MNLLEDERFNHWSYVEGGILEEACGQLLTDFFRALREKKKQK
jgi:tRNA(adenine34) deaminase